MKTKVPSCALTLTFSFLVLCPAWAEELRAGAPRRGCLVTQQQVLLSDGSEIHLDHLAYCGLGSEYFDASKRPNAAHPVGRITLPHRFILPDGAPLDPGWYKIVVHFRP